MEMAKLIAKSLSKAISNNKFYSSKVNKLLQNINEIYMSSFVINFTDLFPLKT